jgi:hypothetical protein
VESISWPISRRKATAKVRALFAELGLHVPLLVEELYGQHTAVYWLGSPSTGSLGAPELILRAPVNGVAHLTLPAYPSGMAATLAIERAPNFATMREWLVGMKRHGGARAFGSESPRQLRPCKQRRKFPETLLAGRRRPI